MSLEDLINALGGSDEEKYTAYGSLAAIMQESEKRSQVAANAGMFSRIAVRRPATDFLCLA